MATTHPQTVEFYYDIVCPFAYIASLRLPLVANHTSTKISYQPVLLGGIYRLTQAQQGAHGSASDVANPAKRAYGSRSFDRTCRRLGIPIQWPSKDNHPVRSVNALRMLYGIPDELVGASGSSMRAVVSAALYRAYWVENRGKEVLGSKDQLLQVARDALRPVFEKAGKDVAELDRLLTMAVFDDPANKAALENNTAKAVSRGAPGVPGFWVPDVEWAGPGGDNDLRKGRFFWGQDRMHFLHAMLLDSAAKRNAKGSGSLPKPQSLLPRCRPLQPLKGPEKVRLEFWFDFSSPWAYLGYTGLSRLQKQFGGPEKLEIVLRPLLLGIVFREIGSPMLPSFAISKQKRNWANLDMLDWQNFWRSVDERDGLSGEEVQPARIRWPDVFPIRSPNLLRCALVDESVVPTLYRACWVQNKNMSDDAVLVQILDEAGFDGKGLLAKAKSPEIKQQLVDNTKEAIDAGFCGVPTYRVFRHDESVKVEGRNKGWKQFGGFVWGQDETALVQDLISGWNEDGESGEVAKIEAVEAGDKARL